MRVRRDAADSRAVQDAFVGTLLEHTARGERASIARELHDVVAHHISIIAVQAETARLTIPDMPAAGAKRLSAIGDTARAALTEMRRLLGVLREDADSGVADRNPQPGLRQLNDLLDEARDVTGAGTRLILTGRPVPLDPGVELAAYRIVQEALTNSRRHAPGAAVDVELKFRADALRLLVRDNGPGSSWAAGGSRPRADGHARAGRRRRRAVAHGPEHGRRIPRRGDPADPPGNRLSTGTATISVVVADDHEVVRTGFAALLGTQPDFSVVGTAADGAEAVRICLEQRPDVVLMDVRMPMVDGIEATRRLGAAGVSARVLILTTFDLDHYVYDAIRAGASGFLLKDVTAEHLFDAVRVIAGGDALLAPTVTRRLIRQFVEHAAVPTDATGRDSARPDGPQDAALRTLTPRETQVLRLVAQGLSNPEIAARLTVTEETVKTHVSRMLAKLQLRDRTQAVVTAYESGLVVPGSGVATTNSLL